MKKRILFRINSMKMGGVPKVLIDVVKNLDKDKFDPFILLDLNQGELRDEIPADIKVFSLAKGREDMHKMQPLLFFSLL
ncbi:hypothetical protein CHRY9390_02434 [Chryseobacterium aquaeductus]|uniref:Uncharacterized protein n=1 Tax=Chryseobacterium aquaeductus TaxID=2675056 RepID=A0A9N8QSP1_9FLAO|nr:glycosyltransferase [Chryseobacterium aquaeductus]CAA7331720.1 hypothetical protein CHRY9390_02434 [Chryseobacterium potabilaquae]CAD7811901.1 hypothetical protein CHRY9390_02434 [Chryseobacterium aquaeductus]